MTLTPTAVLSESQPPLHTDAMPSPTQSRGSYWHLRREPTQLPPCVLTDYIETAVWKDSALSKIWNLRWLDAGWDGPDSQPIPPVAIKIAYDIAESVAKKLPNIVAPTILPTHYFGVLLEWYTTVRHLAFTVDANGIIEVDYRDKERNIEWEGLLVDCSDPVWLSVLSDCR